MGKWAKKPVSRVKNTRQYSIFDQAEKAKNEGIEASYSHAPTIWKKAAGEALLAVCHKYIHFTTDEIWDELAKRGIHTGENRAMGAVMVAAKRSGIVKFTNTYRPTTRPEGHKGPKAIWESNLTKKDYEAESL